MNLEALSNPALDAKVISLAKKDKELLAETILHVAEVERRKLYLQLQITSLYNYLTRHAGFAGGSAYRLMDAARLQMEAPSLAKKIESGQINMNQVRLIQEASRQREKEDHLKAVESDQPTLLDFICSSAGSELGGNADEDGFQLLNSSISEVAVHRDSLFDQTGDSSATNSESNKFQKADILESIENMSAAETEKLVAQSFNLKVKQPMKVTRQKDGTIVVHMSFTAEQWAEIEKAKVATSTSLPTGSYPEVIAHLAKQENAKHEKVAKPRPTSQTVTPAKKKFVVQRDKCCQHVNKLTGEVCESKFNLQVDHIQPRWAGGSNDVSNLQVLCASHNRMKYWEEAGIRRC